MTYNPKNAEQERRIGGPLIDVAQVLDAVYDTLDGVDVTPGDIVDDFIQLVSLLAPEPGHHMLACNKARAVAQEWVANHQQAQP